MKKTTLSRRTMLRGAGGACLALPFLEIMGGWDTNRLGANGSKAFAPPKRLVIVYTPRRDAIRIISARKANQREVRDYENRTRED